LRWLAAELRGSTGSNAAIAGALRNLTLLSFRAWRAAPGAVASLIKAKEPRAAQWPTRMRRRSRRSFAAAHRLAGIGCVVNAPRATKTLCNLLKKEWLRWGRGRQGTGSQAADSGFL